MWCRMARTDSGTFHTDAWASNRMQERAGRPDCEPVGLALCGSSPLFAKGHTIDLSPIFGPRINLIQDALEGDFAFSHTDDVNVWIVDIAVGEIS